ncbi:hypothetical protein Kpol_311p2 [Vanderwaltozyma polyspora DSM 70294]|uniref:RRM domain-containing protein n=1 Tax=Vanderwaltozyma polyspora (strain ATCC 22028 / DSM 70294 / BCRC 21397 / CBS 2163 / NBRC 10782 / NRRL Y-8283 / UCD 57-17) TaxID=436907 RepID=A7TSN8_VANPO|nr:uncharacterized protein Kpol_311p2 [Vanderwaltozyma polyspora DSM 70294]EDO14717.1 hypothetical protein Kpol_311p2 [Vanderwaltozyma polyspora DSM 70294]
MTEDIIENSKPRTTSIFVGNLGLNVDENDLRELFQEFEIESITISKSKNQMILNLYSIITINGTVDIKEAKSKYDNYKLKDTNIRVHPVRRPQLKRKSSARSSNSFNSQRSMLSRSSSKNLQKEKSKDTVYVNNVSYETTKEEIADFFGTNIDMVVLPMRKIKNHKTNKIHFSRKFNKGIAFVTFPELDKDITEIVDKFQGKKLNDRILATDIALLREPNNRTQI